MRALKFVLLIVALIMLFLAVSSVGIARPLDCVDACDWSVRCDLVCWEGRTTTCGDFGVCRDLQCTPHWVEAGKDSAGGYQKCGVTWPLPAFYYCQHYTVYHFRYRDTAGCYGDRIVCRAEYDDLRMSTDPVKANTCDWWTNAGPWGKGICGGKQGCP